jgi:uncharacterized protein YdaL
MTGLPAAHRFALERLLAALVALVFLCLPQIALAGPPPEAPSATKSVLILFEGSDVPTNYARGDARQLAMLMGHFRTTTQVKGVASYGSGDIEKADITFFIGFTKECVPPRAFLQDAYATAKPLVWLNTGLDVFTREFDLAGKFGFSVNVLDTTSVFDRVRSGGREFTKGEENLNLIQLAPGSSAEVLATAYSTATHRESPYIVRSKNFLYVGDSPFASATETDRYVLFADMLHEILGQPHEEIHRALLRIEDVDLFEDPARLREIADMLYDKRVPFLVGVIPYFVDPGAGLRLSLSDKPEFVDAIHYMVSRGATIIMHGATHQYQGVTATDFEFWDESLEGPIKSDSKEYVEKKLAMGLEEFWKNGIYPLVWETPHYTASQLDYGVFGNFFSTAMEQRMVIDDANYSQYFPYIIERDLFGQRIIPENLGYIPLSDDVREEEAAVEHLLAGARTQLAVRDGFASAFIHPFIDLRYIEEYVDGILEIGYTFMDVRTEPHVVRLKDRIIATGSASYTIHLEDQYVRETWLAPDGEIDHREISQERVHGAFQKSVEIPPGQVYLVEPSEYRETKQTFLEQVRHEAGTLWRGLFRQEESFDAPRVALLWNPGLTGGAYKDQASFASAFRALNIAVDTLAGDSVGDLGRYNLLLAPHPTIERLSDADYGKIVSFVEAGGRLVTDGKNGLAQELGVTFAQSFLKIERMTDLLYPEDPLILGVPETMPRFEVEKEDEVLCVDAKSDAPVAIGRAYGKGKFVFLGIRFDPVSELGTSRFPFLMEYVRSYLKLTPSLRRDDLEVYFDPGFRHNMSIEDLVKHWVAEGVRVVHAASWHQYPTWSYDYGRLIRLAHDNGILVYAWLEPPQVSQKFWKEHPAWQEVNAKGEAVRPSWRYPVALTDSTCLAAVKATYRSFLEEFDWDGVNLAELYFEAGDGPKEPRLLTPMHPSARTRFRAKAGFDPAALLDSASGLFWRRNPGAWKSFEEFRVDELARLHEQFLSMIQEVKRDKPYLDVIVTAMDNLGTPSLRMNYGVDIHRIMRLASRYPFTLQIEDPESEWSKSPDRYQAIGERYRDAAPDSLPLMLDLNILQFRSEAKPNPFPTLIQSGTETFQLVRSAALGAERFSIYSESSVRPQDMRFLAYAASARAHVTATPDGWNVDAPHQVVLELPADYRALRLDNGARIISEVGRFLLPAGVYHVTAEHKGGLGFIPPTGGELLSISGTLTSLASGNRSVTFTYKSAGRCAASFSHTPYAVLVDGREYSVEHGRGHRRFSILLPPGEHSVNVVLETGASYGVDITSFWSSWFIVAFGMLSGAALLTFYSVVRVSRRKEEQV